MFKSSVVFVLAVMFGLFSLLPAEGIHETIPSESQIPLPGPSADSLNEYITRYNPYSKWELWPGKGRLYPGERPHGAFLTTFVNEKAYYSIKNRTPMRDGAIIAKENYSADRKFDSLTVMYKIKGYNPQFGDWFWVKYAPDGKPLVEGKAESCIECHSTRKNSDFLFYGEKAK